MVLSLCPPHAKGMCCGIYKFVCWRCFQEIALEIEWLCEGVGKKVSAFRPYYDEYRGCSVYSSWLQMKLADPKKMPPKIKITIFPGLCNLCRPEVEVDSGPIPTHDLKVCRTCGVEEYHEGMFTGVDLVDQCADCIYATRFREVGCAYSRGGVVCHGHVGMFNLNTACPTLWKLWMV